MVEVTSPKEKWGPANTEDRGDRYKLPTLSVYSVEIGPDSEKQDIANTETHTNGTIVHNGATNTAFDGSE